MKKVAGDDCKTKTDGKFAKKSAPMDSIDAISEADFESTDDQE